MKKNAIVYACDRILNGELDNHFPLGFGKQVVVLKAI